MTERRFIFICGCGHTGTSLMANLFAARSDVFIPMKETGIFLKKKPDWDPLMALSVLEKEADRLGKAHICEKTPQHIRKVESIRRLVRGCRFIVMVRDGRDVAASMKHRFGEFEIGMEKWVRDTSFSLKACALEDAHLVKYEDLVTNTKNVVIRICDMLEIPFQQSMLEHHQAERRWFGQRQLRKGSGLDGKEHNALRNWQINQVMSGSRKDVISCKP